MLKVVEVIGVASTGGYEGDASLVAPTKIVRMVRLGSISGPPYNLAMKPAAASASRHLCVAREAAAANCLAIR
jgi:hypothetical protein